MVEQVAKIFLDPVEWQITSTDFSALFVKYKKKLAEKIEEWTESRSSAKFGLTSNDFSNEGVKVVINLDAVLETEAKLIKANLLRKPVDSETWKDNWHLDENDQHSRGRNLRMGQIIANSLLAGDVSVIPYGVSGSFGSLSAEYNQYGRPMLMEEFLA